MCGWRVAGVAGVGWTGERRSETAGVEGRCLWRREGGASTGGRSRGVKMIVECVEREEAGPPPLLSLASSAVGAQVGEV